MAIVRINKLYGQFTNEIDLSKRCTILIGENGLGKSTLLKILNALMNHNYIELSRFYFENIEIIDDKAHRIKYSELFPSLKSLSAEMSDSPEHEMIIKYLEKLEASNIVDGYAKLLACIYFNHPVPQRIQRIVPSAYVYDPVNELPIYQVIKSILETMILSVQPDTLIGDTGDNEVGESSGNHRRMSVFNKSQFMDTEYFVDVVNRGFDRDHHDKRTIWNEWYYYDMVEQYKFDETRVTDSHVTNPQISWINKAVNKKVRNLKPSLQEFFESVDLCKKMALRYFKWVASTLAPKELEIVI